MSYKHRLVKRTHQGIHGVGSGSNRGVAGTQASNGVGVILGGGGGCGIINLLCALSVICLTAVIQLLLLLLLVVMQVFESGGHLMK